MRGFSERGPALEHLINVMRLVMRHIFHLEMHIEVRKLRVASWPMPLGR